MDMHSVCYGFYNLKAPSYGLHCLGPLTWLWLQLQTHSFQYNSLARFYSAAIKPQSSAFKCYTHTFSWRNICFSGIPSVTWENTILRSLISYLNLSSGIKWLYWGNKNPCFNIYPLRNYYMPVCKIPRHKEEENVNLQLVRQVRNVSNYKTVT